MLHCWMNKGCGVQCMVTVVCLTGVQAPPGCGSAVETSLAVLCNLTKRSFPAGKSFLKPINCINTFLFKKKKPSNILKISRIPIWRTWLECGQIKVLFNLHFRAVVSADGGLRCMSVLPEDLPFGRPKVTGVSAHV